MLRIPPVVRRKALASGAGDWLETLPARVGEIAASWSLRIGRVYLDATEALVCEATRGDGTAAVLKISVPGSEDSVRHEVTALDLAAGNGCAKLLHSDETSGALLLERLGPSLHALSRPIRQRHAILCAVAASVWRPAAGHGLPTGADKGRSLAEWIPAAWDETSQPCSARAVERALSCAARRVAAHDDGRAVLVHGDLHQWNALQAPGRFKLVDPDGLLAEAESDLGIVMREDPLELLHGDPHERARRLAARCEVDVTAIWERGVIERVSTGLLATRLEMQPVGPLMLAAADRIAVLA